MKEKLRMFRRVFGMGLALLLCFSCFSASVQVRAAVTSGTCGTDVVWEYDDETQTLTISGSGEMTDYSSDYEVPWYSVSQEIQFVIIEEGVTSIGSRAFYGCNNLTGAEVAQGVTVVGDSAFHGCSSLAEVVLPVGVTHMGEKVFFNCGALTDVTLPDGITSIGKSSFYNCKSLTQIEIPNGITSIEKNMFENCKALEVVKLPNSVTTLETNVFYNCTSLTEVMLPDSMTTIATNSFAFCNGLKTVNVACIWKPSVDSGNFFGAKYVNTANYRHAGENATCVQKATCIWCGEPSGDFDITNHGEEELCNQLEATCTEAGYTGDICCKDCGTVLTKGEVIEAKGHVGGNATCTEKAICEVCGELYGDAAASNHGEEELCNQLEATCTEAGYTGDTCCKDCGTVLTKGEVIEAKGHDYTSEVTMEPTVTENGVLTYTCVNCKDTYTERIEKLPNVVQDITAEVTYASHWGNGGQVEITLTNSGESFMNGWNVELDLNITGELTNSWGDGFVTSFEDGHVMIKNQSWVQSFEAGTTKKVYLQYSGTLPNFVTCDQNGDDLVASINYLNHWGNGGQIEILLENTGTARTTGWGTELIVNLIGTMTGTWGDGFVSSYEEGHIVIQNQHWVTCFEAGAKKSIWLQFDGILPIEASNVQIW